MSNLLGKEALSSPGILEPIDLSLESLQIVQDILRIKDHGRERRAVDLDLIAAAFIVHNGQKEHIDVRHQFVILNVALRDSGDLRLAKASVVTGTVRIRTDSKDIILLSVLLKIDNDLGKGHFWQVCWINWAEIRDQF